MRNLFLLTALLTFAFTFGQEGDKKGNKREMIKQQKIAFITQEVGFTEKEAEKFWPKYNKMEEDRDASSIGAAKWPKTLPIEHRFGQVPII